MCVGRAVGIIEHLPDPAEQDFGGALRFGQAPHGGWDIVRTEIRWPGVRTGWTFDGSLITERSTQGSSHVYERFLSQWTQILHYRRVEELVDVAPGGRQGGACGPRSDRPRYRSATVRIGHANARPAQGPARCSSSAEARS